MNNLSYYKNLQGVMTQFEPLTEADLQKVDADGLTIPEIRNALEKHGLGAGRVGRVYQLKQQR